MTYQIALFPTTRFYREENILACNVHVALLFLTCAQQPLQCVGKRAKCMTHKRGADYRTWDMHVLHLIISRVCKLSRESSCKAVELGKPVLLKLLSIEEVVIIGVANKLLRL